jgi:ADP-ribose pyrophosphatase
MNKITKMNKEDKIIYQGHFTLVKRPYEGKDYDVIVSKDSAIMLYIDEDDIVYFTKQFRPAMGREILELPAETLDKPCLTPVEVMVEGLEEECGIRINKDQVISIGKVNSTDGHDTEQVYLFIAKGKGKNVGQRLQDKEKIEVVKIPFEQAFKMVMDKKIEGSKTAHLILYEKLRRLNGPEK